MKRPSRRPIELVPVEWRQLCAIARTTITDDPNPGEWKLRILDRLRALGFRVAHPAQLDRAMEGLRHLLPKAAPAAPPLLRAARPDPTILPRTRGEAGLTPLAAALATRTGPTCGCLKRGSGIRALVCNREPGHAGDHGVRSAGGVLFVRWSRADDDAPPSQ